MRRFLLVFFVVLASVVPARAQGICWGCIPGDIAEDVYYIVSGNNVGLVTARNVRMVRDLTGQLPRSLGPDLRWNGNAYGLPMTNGGFYPMYDRNRQPMSRRTATVTGAAVGAAIGYGVTGNGRGTVLGAAGGAIVGLLSHRGKNNNDQRNNGAMASQPSQGQGVYIGRDGIPVAVGYRPNMPSAGGYQPVSSPHQQEEGGWTVRNRTGFKVELWDGERFVVLLQPGQSIVMSNPDGIRGVMLIPGNSGRIEQKEATIKASHDFDGWDLIAPSVQ